MRPVLFIKTKGGTLWQGIDTQEHATAVAHILRLGTDISNDTAIAGALNVSNAPVVEL